MTTAINWECVTPEAAVAGEDPAETQQLRAMLDRAEAYLRSFRWCPPIVERFVGYGIGGVLGVFLFKLGSKINGTDDLLWVVEGDVPSAYLVTDNARDPASALATYCDMMEQWANAVLSGSSLDDVFPVCAAPTVEHANMLLSRIRFIRERLMPLIHCRETADE